MNDETARQAVKCFESHDYEQAIILFNQICDSDTTAMYYLGAMYRLGLGVRESQKEAFKWFLKAAQKGHVESQFLVGCALADNDFFIRRGTSLVEYDHNLILDKSLDDNTIWQDTIPFYDLAGYGVEPNDYEAFKWIFRAAESNYSPAQLVLGDMYDWGVGVDVNELEAIKWYEKASLNNNSDAILRLAGILSDEHEDVNKIIELLKKAYELGNNRAALKLGRIYEREVNDETHMEQAIYWYNIAANNYHCIESQIRLGDFYLEGKWIDLNINQAITCYKKAITYYYQNRYYGYCFEPYRKLYELYKTGITNAISESEIIDYLIMASDSKSDKAMMELKTFYQKGYDIGEKYKKTFDLLVRADFGEKIAQIEYGYQYIVNRFIEEETKNKALKWYLDDAFNGSIDAQYLLAHTYNPHSFETEHYFWLKKAADNGHTDAQYEIARKIKYENSSDYIKFINLSSESNIYAQIDLGYNYAHGLFIELNYNKAYNLYQIAANNMKQLKDISELRKINNIKMRYNASNDKAENLAINGDIEAQLYMGCLYQYGFEVKRDLDKAIYWYSLAKSNGSVEGVRQLEIIHKEMET